MAKKKDITESSPSLTLEDLGMDVEALGLDGDTQEVDAKPDTGITIDDKIHKLYEVISDMEDRLNRRINDLGADVYGAPKSEEPLPVAGITPTALPIGLFTRLHALLDGGVNFTITAANRVMVLETYRNGSIDSVQQFASADEFLASK